MALKLTQFSIPFLEKNFFFNLRVKKHNQYRKFIIWKTKKNYSKLREHTNGIRNWHFEKNEFFREKNKQTQKNVYNNGVS